MRLGLGWNRKKEGRWCKRSSSYKDSKSKKKKIKVVTKKKKVR
jgi:hypothetical protein